MRLVVSAVFDWLRFYEAGHPLMVQAVEHFRTAADEHSGDILTLYQNKVAAAQLSE